MIPKIIHYCWFGRNKKSALIKKCIKSWKKYCPEFEIIEWNEDNFDIHCNTFCSKAYEAKKWAFVSDYARLKILYDCGGIYMDTDVEVLASISQFLELNCFLGFQHENYVSNGLMTGSIPENWFIKENMSVYETIDFQDNSNSKEFKVCQEYTTEILSLYGLRIPCDEIQVIKDVYVYPREYFCPYDHRTRIMRKTEKTVAIHHYASSWWDENRKHEYKKSKRMHFMHELTHVPNKLLRKLLGDKVYGMLKKSIKFWQKK